MAASTSAWVPAVKGAMLISPCCNNVDTGCCIFGQGALKPAQVHQLQGSCTDSTRVHRNAHGCVDFGVGACCQRSYVNFTMLQQCRHGLLHFRAGCIQAGTGASALRQLHRFDKGAPKCAWGCVDFSVGACRQRSYVNFTMLQQCRHGLLHFRAGCIEAGTGASALRQLHRFDKGAPKCAWLRRLQRGCLPSKELC